MYAARIFQFLPGRAAKKGLSFPADMIDLILSPNKRQPQVKILQYLIPFEL
jgi:hypothetical protein